MDHLDQQEQQHIAIPSPASPKLGKHVSIKQLAIDHGHQVTTYTNRGGRGAQHGGYVAEAVLRAPGLRRGVVPPASQTTSLPPCMHGRPVERPRRRRTQSGRPCRQPCRRHAGNPSSGTTRRRAAPERHRRGVGEAARRCEELHQRPWQLGLATGVRRGREHWIDEVEKEHRHKRSSWMCYMAAEVAGGGRESRRPWRQQKGIERGSCREKERGTRGGGALAISIQLVINKKIKHFSFF